MSGIVSRDSKLSFASRKSARILNLGEEQREEESSSDAEDKFMHLQTMEDLIMSEILTEKQEME